MSKHTFHTLGKSWKFLSGHISVLAHPGPTDQCLTVITGVFFPIKSLYMQKQKQTGLYSYPDVGILDLVNEESLLFVLINFFGFTIRKIITKYPGAWFINLAVS